MKYPTDGLIVKDASAEIQIIEQQHEIGIIAGDHSIGDGQTDRHLPFKDEPVAIDPSRSIRRRVGKNRARCTVALSDESRSAIPDESRTTIAPESAIDSESGRDIPSKSCADIDKESTDNESAGARLGIEGNPSPGAAAG